MHFPTAITCFKAKILFVTSPFIPPIVETKKSTRLQPNFSKSKEYPRSKKSVSNLLRLLWIVAAGIFNFLDRDKEVKFSLDDTISFRINLSTSESRFLDVKKPTAWEVQHTGS